MRWERIGSKFKFCNKENTQLNIKANEKIYVKAFTASIA